MFAAPAPAQLTRHDALAHARQGVSSTSALTLNQFVDLFGKVQSVVVFNQALLDKIRRRVGEWSDDAKIGDIFLDASTEMRIYTHYVNNYSRGSYTHRSRARQRRAGATHVRNPPSKTTKLQKNQPWRSFTSAVPASRSGPSSLRSRAG